MSCGLGSSSVQRNFSCIKAVVNFVILEKGLDCSNPFSGVYLHSDNSSKKRRPIPLDSLKILQQRCVLMDDDLRHLVSLISDTGMRLSEVASYSSSKIN